MWVNLARFRQILVKNVSFFPSACDEPLFVSHNSNRLGYENSTHCPALVRVLLPKGLHRGLFLSLICFENVRFGAFQTLPLSGKHMPHYSGIELNCRHDFGRIPSWATLVIRSNLRATLRKYHAA